MALTTKITTRTKIVVLGVLSLAVTLAAQTPPPPPPPQNPPAGAQPAQPGQRGGRGGGGRLQVMTLTTSAWPDGGAIPAKHAQSGGEVSPPLAWSNAPEGVGSFVLIVHDLDSTAGGRGGPVTDLLHWMIWNIPATAKGLTEAIPHESELPDGSRQIGATGPGYRGPGAPADGPPHHYVFELYALDGPLEVAAVGASPAETRAAVLAAMAGRVRGKASMVGLFKRGA